MLLPCDTTYCYRRIVTGTGTTHCDICQEQQLPAYLSCAGQRLRCIMVHIRAVLALALLLCLITYLGHLLTSFRMFTMLLKVLSINTKLRMCCFFQILSGECCETELFPTSDASRAQYPKHCSCHCTWMASLDILISPSPQADQWRSFAYLHSSQMI